MVKKIMVTIGNSTFTIENEIVDDESLDNDLIKKCLNLVNCYDSPDGYKINLIANDTILRVKPK